MGYFILAYHLDFVAFALFLAGSMIFVQLWIRRAADNPRFTFKAWIALAAITLIGCYLAQASGESEKRRIERAISGLAPTYASEMARGGLAKINEHTAADDPTYLALIDDQIRWQKDNPGIADIYTMGRNDKGEFILLVDSETDYNHNGVIDDEREKRTPIGEVYEEDHDLLEQAITGTPVFTPQPTTDRWGTWISTYVPVLDEKGKPFAILGVDFDAKEYVRSILWHRGAMLSLAGIIGMILISSFGLLAILRGEMAKRELLHDQLVDASRKAGMAEIATGVLHNVGNVLNSVNVSAAVIAEKIKAPEMAELASATELFTTHKDHLADYLTCDASGKHVPEYVAALAQCLNAQNRELDHEVAQLNKGIEHIMAIVRSQQEYVKSDAVIQQVHPADLIQEATDLSASSPKDDGITLIPEIAIQGKVAIDKHRVLQVLVNLIRNSRHALVEAASEQPRVIIRVRRDDGSSHLFWEVSDNGPGIPPENVARIFQHGFTTKTDGHGFGLHSCANAATEMGGKLSVHSDGPGTGATFILDIPEGGRKEVEK